MATELKEARIKVVLDLQDAKDEAKAVEKTVDKTARKQKKIGRDESESETGTGRVSSKKIALKDLTHGTLFNALTEILKAIPLAGVVFAGAIGVAEGVERFGPAVGAFIQKFLDDNMSPAIRKSMELAGIDFNDLADAAKFYSEKKAFLSSISQGFERATQTSAAIAITGGSISPSEAKQEFYFHKVQARFEIELLKTRRRILQMMAGEGVANAFSQALSATSLQQSVGK